MMTLGFYYNQSACTGCRACQVACKDRNDLPVGILYRHVKSYQTGKFPAASLYHYAATCNHCESPACVANCPTGAMQKADDGTVQHDDSACIGCGTCARSCPYEVPQLFEDKGLAGKCDSCKAFRDAGQNPVCVDACCMRALDFGDLDELAQKYGADLVSELPCLLGADTTGPSTLIQAKACALNDDFKEAVL